MECWQPSTKTPVLSPGAVHVWRVNLNKSAIRCEALLQSLSAQEQACAKRLVQEKHRRRFIVAHAALRDILSSYLKTTAQDLQFYKGSHGKPYLIGPSTLQFNMSHSHDIAVYAVTLDREVGIDVECMKSGIEVEGIATRFFSEEEVHELLGLPVSEQFEAFYRCWVRKEAYLKGIGQGLSFPLNRFAVSLDREGLDGLLHVDNSTEAAKLWFLGDIPVDKKYAAALAVEGKVSQIRLFEFHDCC